jgi:phosphoadenosine phosphosulfate reductase
VGLEASLVGRWQCNGKDMLGLAFSGGKDSLACWYMYREQQPVVMWVNTGKAYPETIAIVNEIRAEAKEFIEIPSDQQAQIERTGIPSDVVPVDWTVFGVTVAGEKPIKIQTYFGCCFENIAMPLMETAKTRGITRLIRGQRLNDGHKSSAVNNSIVDGITYVQPIETWTEEQVFAFILKHRAKLPDHYAIKHTSLDCYDCTAFLGDSADRVAWTKLKYPAFYAKYAANMADLKTALAPSMKIVGTH